jgi:outer membrane biosynthesis protein TonB
MSDLHFAMNEPTGFIPSRLDELLTLLGGLPDPDKERAHDLLLAAVSPEASRALHEADAGGVTLTQARAKQRAQQGTPEPVKEPEPPILLPTETPPVPPPEQAPPPDQTPEPNPSDQAPYRPPHPAGQPAPPDQPRPTPGEPGRPEPERHEAAAHNPNYQGEHERVEPRASRGNGRRSS